MKKALLFAFASLLSISLLACTPNGRQETPKDRDETDRAAVARLVEDFGSRLQAVSLQAPSDMLAEDMEREYGEYVSQELLSQWLSDPLNAPGRLTSSPWPDRIEILAIEEMTEDRYEVQADVVEIASAEKENEKADLKRPITLVVKRIEDRWLIDAVILGAYEAASSIIYENAQYGFSFSLPKSWEGYSAITETWEGPVLKADPQADRRVETGPMILLRHPQWTDENPRQDIPIMIFALDQWGSLQEGEFNVGAAPIPPRELGRNKRYVFALPARYNYAFPIGYEEVEDILERYPLQINDEYQE